MNQDADGTFWTMAKDILGGGFEVYVATMTTRGVTFENEAQARAAFLAGALWMSTIVAQCDEAIFERIVSEALSQELREFCVSPMGVEFVFEGTMVKAGKPS